MNEESGDPVNQRLAACIATLTPVLHGAIREAQVTEEELWTAVRFLNEIGEAGEFMLLSDVLGVSVVVDHITHDTDGAGTDANVMGPFYVPDAPLLDPPYALAPAGEPGEPLEVAGRVTDAVTGSPIAGAVLDVWQADVDGLYANQVPGRDPYHLRGRISAEEDGSYRFTTVTPPPYEIKKDGPVGRLLYALGRHAFRPAHLHLKISAPDHVGITTMIYFAGDPWLDSDTIGAVKPSLIVPIDRGNGAGAADPAPARCRFDVTLRPVDRA